MRWNEGAWTYGDVKHLHAPTKTGSASLGYNYDNNGNATSRNGKAIGWDAYNFPATINNSTSEYINFYYDGNHARWKSVYVNGSTTETTIHVGDLMEKVSSANSTVDYRHYIYAGTSRTPVAVYSRTGTANSQNKVRYLLDDPQDSVVSILDSAGAVVVNESYTAYGNRRNPDTWSGAPANAQKTAIVNVTRQGYTWQTALGDMGLNHMNGRVQDAVTGTFLSADLYIGRPMNTQNYNLYGYVYNNPLTLNDPTGYCPPGTGQPVSEAGFSSSLEQFADDIKRKIQMQMESRGARDRGRTARPDGTPRPNKHIKPHPTRPGWVIDNSRPDGKKVERPARPGEPGYSGPTNFSLPNDDFGIADTLVVGGVVFGSVLLIPEVVIPALILGAAAQ